MTKKKIALLLMFILMFNVFICSANASEDGIMPRWSNCSSCNTSFVVFNGVAEASVQYVGYSTMSSVDFKIEIQKNTFWFIWSTLETWTSTSIEKGGTYIFTTATDGNGTYRAKFTLTFHGTDGTTDVLEDTIEFKYNG